MDLEQDGQVVDSHGGELDLLASLTDTGESTGYDTCGEGVEHIAGVGVSTVQVALCKLHGELVRILDLRPVGLVILLSQLLVRLEQAVQHAGTLEDKDVEGSLHGDLHHEWVLGRVLSIQIRLGNCAG